MPEFLTAVCLVCNGHMHQVAAPHVAHSIDAFLWPRSKWTLESASKHGCVLLLDRLLKNEWPGFNRKYRESRLRQAIQHAVYFGYDVRVVKWWFSKCMPGQEVVPLCDVYDKAIQCGHLPVLDWINEETKGDLPHMKNAVHFASSDITTWLIDHGISLSSRWLYLHKTYTASFQSMKRCLIYQDEGRIQIGTANRALQIALIDGRLEDLLWMYEHRPKFFNPSTLRDAVRYGNLQAAQWLVATYPQHYFNNPKRTFDEKFDDLGPYRYNLAVIKWVLRKFEWRKERSRSDWMREARDYAARSGKLEMLEFVFSIYTERQKSAEAAAIALEKWILRAKPSIMDEAARNGDLNMLTFLHSHPGSISTTKAMDLAAANGHLVVVQWLHQNRSDGCTENAMNAAAAGGHLAVVQWLHENRAEGSTRKAMDRATENGQLDVVKFLYTRLQEGCSSVSMAIAASYGHFETFKWLHENGSVQLPQDWRDRFFSAEEKIFMCLALCSKVNCQLVESSLSKLIYRSDFETIEKLVSIARRESVGSTDKSSNEFAELLATIERRLELVP